MEVCPMTKRTKISSLLILLLVLLCLPTDTAAADTAWDGSSKAPTAHYKRIGSGDSMRYELEYYTVSDAAQLRGLATLLSPEVPVYLTCDIWLNPDDAPVEYEFPPIGGGNRAFVGTFDGQGHTVHNLYINQPNRDKTGLFGRVSGTIRNLTVTGKVTGHTDTAGVVGYLDRGTISNVINKVTVSGYLEVGGVAGYAGGSVTSSKNYRGISSTYGAGGIAGSSSSAIKDCDNYGNISVTETAAGGVTSASSGTITNSRNFGAVNGTQQSGGVVCALNGTVTGCINYGAITGDFYIGGIASRIYTGGRIDTSYNYGHVEAKNMAGGITGYNDKGTIENCHNRKEVMANIMVAGIAGYNKGLITNCTSTGKITSYAENYTGGIAGENDGEINGSHFEEGSADGTSGRPDASTGTEENSGAENDAWFDENYPADKEPTPGADIKQDIILTEDLTIETSETYPVSSDTNLVISGGVTVTDKGTLDNDGQVTRKDRERS